jgi:hypothetical protein
MNTALMKRVVANFIDERLTGLFVLVIQFLGDKWRCHGT